jgi:hypothetical protein
MKKPILLLFTLFFISSSLVLSQDCKLSNNYDSFIKVERKQYGEKHYLKREVISPQDKYCFSKAVQNIPVFFEYILTNFKDWSIYSELTEIADSNKLKNVFFANLEQDSLFNQTIGDYQEIVFGKSTKDTISKADLINIAVKFFSVTKALENGNYEGKICVGINSLEATEAERKPMIEAFCFSTLMTGKGDSLSSKIFVKALKKVIKINLGVDQEERLLRAQGALFALMSESDVLNDLLLEHYAANKEYLPFILKEED